MRIAILQRDPVRSKQLERILVQAGHSCMVYDDGLTMSKALARSTADLLVLDWHGVRMSGIDVLKSMRAVNGDRVPVIFASTDDSEESVVRALIAGADDYVTFPVRTAEFRERSRRYCGAPIRSDSACRVSTSGRTTSIRAVRS